MMDGDTLLRDTDTSSTEVSRIFSSEMSRFALLTRMVL